MMPLDDEICRVVFEMDGSSAPGLDRFSGMFYHFCWDIIGWNVSDAVKFFFRSGVLPLGLNLNF